MRKRKAKTSDNIEVLVDFAPEAHQLARVARVTPASRWMIAMPVISTVVLMGLWLFAEPGAAVSNGTVSLSASEKVSSSGDLFQLPEWHDDPDAANTAAADPGRPKPVETADLR